MFKSLQHFSSQQEEGLLSIFCMCHCLHSRRGNYRLKLITSYALELGSTSGLQHFAVIKAIGYNILCKPRCECVEY